MTTLEVRIFGADNSEEIWLTETDKGVEVMCDALGTEVTVTLDAFGIRKLRLTAQRMERAMADRAKAGN